jgi:glycosyl transferase family 25
MKAVNEWVDGVYVLTVKTFVERMAHIRRELGGQGIEFEFLLDHDAAELDPELVRRVFATSDLRPTHQSLVLKHISAWRSAKRKGQRRTLVFEDDALLAPGFRVHFDAGMRAADALEPGWLIYLGGADVKVPDSYFLAPGPLVSLPIATTEAYVTDLAAVEKRLAWVEHNRITLPADFLIRHIDAALGIRQYWLRPSIVEQGSCVGLFDSMLDANRQKHSRLYTVLRNRWNKFQRHRLRGWLVKARAMIAGS